jgi:hypothetical protein
MRYKTRMVLRNLRIRIAGSNSAQGMDVGLVRVFVLSCFVYYRGLGRGRSPVHESDRLNYCFLLNSDSEPEKEPNLLHTQRKKKNKC